MILVLKGTWGYRLLLGFKALRRVLRLCGHGDAEGEDHDGCQYESGHEEVLEEVDMDDTVPDGLQGSKSSLARQKLWQVIFSLSLIHNKEGPRSLGSHSFPPRES